MGHGCLALHFLAAPWAGLPDAAEPLLAAASDLSEWTPSRLGGRLHPLFVHFPIGLVFAAAALEAWRSVRRQPGFAPGSVPLLTAAAATAVAAAGSGWLNAAWEHSKESSDELFWHRWIGTASAALLIVVAWLAWRSVRAETFASAHSARRLGALVAALVVAVVGHLGGELVHGEGYVLEGLRTRARGGEGASKASNAAPQLAASNLPVAQSAEDIAILDAATRVFATHCAECHGAKKQKGGLRLNPLAAAFAGPREDWAILPGKPDASEVVARIEFPADDPDAMPPKGERLSAADIAAVRAWIERGALVSASEKFEAAPKADVLGARADDPAVRAAAERVSERGAIAHPLFSGSELYEVDVQLASQPWSDADLERVHGLCAVLVELSLAKSAITDEALLRLPSAPQLERIRLDGTSFTDHGVPALLAMPKLESVNLVGTALTDEGFIQLAAHPSLRRVFVWQTKVTAAGADRAKQLRPELDIVGAPSAAPSSTAPAIVP